MKFLNILCRRRDIGMKDMCRIKLRMIRGELLV